MEKDIFEIIERLYEIYNSEKTLNMPCISENDMVYLVGALIELTRKGQYDNE